MLQGELLWGEQPGVIGRVASKAFVIPPLCLTLLAVGSGTPWEFKIHHLWFEARAVLAPKAKGQPLSSTQ